MQSNTKKVAVVILNWNGAKLMEEFLPSVMDYSPAELAEVIVADNGSTDASVDMLKEKFPAVRIIQLDKNYGFAEGYNQALKQIDNEYTVLLNSDVEVTPGWLDAPLAALEADATIAAAQPKIRAQRNKEYFEYAGAAGGYMDIYGYPYCRGRMLHVVEKDEAQYDTPADILWATGACLFIRTTIYKEVGGLDAGFFAHQEEIGRDSVANKYQYCEKPLMGLLLSGTFGQFFKFIPSADDGLFSRFLAYTLDKPVEWKNLTDEDDKQSTGKYYPDLGQRILRAGLFLDQNATFVHYTKQQRDRMNARFRRLTEKSAAVWRQRTPGYREPPRTCPLPYLYDTHRPTQSRATMHTGEYAYFRHRLQQCDGVHTRFPRTYPKPEYALEERG